MAFFSVNILTPSKVLGKALQAESLELNTEMGQIGVLPRHMNLLSSLAPGVVKLVDAEREKYFFVTSGVIKVLAEQVTIISAAAEPVEEIDPERAKHALEKAKDKLKDVAQLSDEERIKYERKMIRAELRMKASLLASKN